MAETAAAKRAREKREAEGAVAAVAEKLTEDAPDPEVANLKRELAELRAKTDERVARAVESAKLETRPSITSPQADHSEYSADAEVRRQWPLAFEDEKD